MWTKSTVLLILAAALVNWLPKIFPYLLIKFAKLPAKVVAFLSYLPISIMFALLLSSILTTAPGQLPRLKWVEALAIVPTYVLLKKSHNIVWAVLAGVACVALLRALVGY